MVLELIRNKAGPVAIVLSEMDTHILLGSIVAEELYGLSMPVIVTPKENLQNFHSGNAGIFKVAVGRAPCDVDGDSLQIPAKVSSRLTRARLARSMAAPITNTSLECNPDDQA